MTRIWQICSGLVGVLLAGPLTVGAATIKAVNKGKNLITIGITPDEYKRLTIGIASIETKDGQDTFTGMVLALKDDQAKLSVDTRSDKLKKDMEVGVFMVDVRNAPKIEGGETRKYRLGIGIVRNPYDPWKVVLRSNGDDVTGDTLIDDNIGVFVLPKVQWLYMGQDFTVGPEIAFLPRKTMHLRTQR